MYEKLTLGHEEARKTHTAIINDSSGYTLTLTLNPRYNSLPVDQQYNKFIRQIKKLFVEIEAYYNTVMITCEFTKDYNVHAHLYLTTDVEDIITFEQNFKKEKLKYDVIGRNYKLKHIGGPEYIQDFEALNNYPFKDIERTKKYSETENCLFNPFHYVKRVRNVGSLRSPAVAHSGSINIDKFLEFVNSQKNI